MFFAENLKTIFYVASRSVNSDGVFVYGTPVMYRANCRNVTPTSASADLVTVGTSYFQDLQILGDPEYLSSIKPFDRVYVYVSPPVQTDVLAKTADYMVNSVVPYPTCTRILLEKLTTE